MYKEGLVINEGLPREEGTGDQRGSKPRKHC